MRAQWQSTPEFGPQKGVRRGRKVGRAEGRKKKIRKKAEKGRGMKSDRLGHKCFSRRNSRSKGPEAGPASSVKEEAKQLVREREGQEELGWGPVGGHRRREEFWLGQGWGRSTAVSSYGGGGQLEPKASPPRPRSPSPEAPAWRLEGCNVGTSGKQLRPGQGGSRGTGTGPPRSLQGQGSREGPGGT